MSELMVSNGTLVVPSATGEARTFNIHDTQAAEGMLGEVAVMTKAKAPIFLDLFNQAMLKTRKVMSPIQALKNAAKDELARVRATIILEVVPDYLEKRKANQRSPYGSEDIREAIVVTQDSYRRALDVFQQLEAAYQYLDDSYQAFKNAYFAIQALVKEFEPERNV